MTGKGPSCIQAHGCCSPFSCANWGYCRQRNIDAGGMKNVSPADQAAWRTADTANPSPPTPGGTDNG